MKFRYLALAVIVSATAANAQEIDCENAMTQSAMNRCSFDELVLADAELNEVYSWAMAHAKNMSEKTATSLRGAQRTWIPYRDAACEAAAAPFEGGSIQPLIVNTCHTQLTQRRTEDLREIYEPK